MAPGARYEDTDKWRREEAERVRKAELADPDVVSPGNEMLMRVKPPLWPMQKTSQRDNPHTNSDPNKYDGAAARGVQQATMRFETRDQFAEAEQFRRKRDKVRLENQSGTLDLKIPGSLGTKLVCTVSKEDKKTHLETIPSPDPTKTAAPKWRLYDSKRPEVNAISAGSTDLGPGTFLAHPSWLEIGRPDALNISHNAVPQKAHRDTVGPKFVAQQLASPEPKRGPIKACTPEFVRRRTRYVPRTLAELNAANKAEEAARAAIVEQHIPDKDKNCSLAWWLQQHGDPTGSLPTRSWGRHRRSQPGSCMQMSATKPIRSRIPLVK